MNDLVEESIKAHGGLDAWRALHGFSGHLSGGGMLFTGVGHPDGVRDLNFSGLCHQAQISQWPIGTSRLRSLVEPAHEALVDDAGRTVEERSDPRHGFPLDPRRRWASWDDLNFAYFAGYAIWTYLTEPFIWTWPGVESEQIAPAEGGHGETLRRLRVRYPASIATHSTEETFYFSDEGLIVRVDYAADVLGGGLRAAHFALDHRRVSGRLIMPTRRLVYARLPDDTFDVDKVVVDLTVDQLEYA